MPEVEQELARHREVFAENGLSWHLCSGFRKSQYASVKKLDPDVKSKMLQVLASRSAVSAQKSWLEVFKQFSEARTHITDQIDELDSRRNEMEVDTYVRESIRLAKDLWSIGASNSARSRLASAFSFATQPSSGVSSDAIVAVGTEYSILLTLENEHERALNDLTRIRSAALALSDQAETKIRYYRAFTTAALQAGFTVEGCAAAQKAIELLGSGMIADALRAEVAEAQFLFGQNLADAEGGVS